MDGSNLLGINDGALPIGPSGHPTISFEQAQQLILRKEQMKQNEAKKGPKTMKKNPTAPKRFKSSFIFFSMAKHKEIKESMASEDKATKTTNITKMVSDAWKNISPEDRAKYDEMAKKDKERYEREKASYTAPPGASRKKQRDPTAPRRPMSAFLAFANSRRAKVKAEQPQCSNGEISKILSGMWKEAADDVKQKYRDEESALWAKYKSEMQDWRKKNEAKLKEAREAGTAVLQPPMAAMEGMAGWKNRKKVHADGVKEAMMPEGGGFEDTMFPGIPNRNFDFAGNPNHEEMIAAAQLRGVRGLGLGQGTLEDAIHHQQQLQQAQNNYNKLLRNGLGAYSSGVGAAAAPGALGGNMTNMALLEMGLPYSQQLGGYPLGSTQAALMAQALHGTSSAYHNQLLGLTADQQAAPLSQLASLAGQNGNGGQNPQYSLPGMNNMFGNHDM